MKTLKSPWTTFWRIMVVVFFLGAVIPLRAQTFWTGPSIGVFYAFDGATDLLTAHVMITRGGGGGLYNAAEEGSATKGIRPRGTQWARGTLAQYMSNPSSLSFGPCLFE